MSRRTRYQSSRYPVRTLEVKCTTTTRNEHELCTACGRWLKRRVAHNPNVTGSLGWVEYYSDGSTYQVPPGQPVSSPGH
jgi:hypothetical protein